jgi:hypothetical protein
VDQQAFDQVIKDTEANRPASNPNFQKHADTIHAVNEMIRRHVDESDPQTIRRWLSVYWPNAWKETMQEVAGTEAPAPSGMGRTPLRGPRGFEHQKTFPRYEDGLAAGLTPAFDTTGEYWKWKVREMAKLAMAERLWNEEGAMGHKIFVGLKRAPEGYDFVRDPIGTVFGRPSIVVSEGFDKKVREGLDAVMASLGIPHERKVGIGGKRAGFFEEETGKVVTRFAGPESVIEHEIGHALDDRYRLWDVLTSEPGTTKEAVAMRKTLQDEMRRLAAMRIEGEDVPPSYRRYIMRRGEKVANALAARMYAPDLLEMNAPTIKRRLETFLREHTELSPLLDIKPSLVLGTEKTEVPVGGIVIHGQWAIPEGSARIINHYTEPGLRAKVPLFNAFANLGSLVVRTKLVGAYHFGVTAANNIYSHLALAERYILDGNLEEAGKQIAQAPASFVTDAVRGKRLTDQFLDIRGTQGELRELLDAVQRGGFRTGLDPFWGTTYRRRFVESVKAGERIGALPEALGALTETITAPLFEKYVPWSKMAAAVDMARFELEKLKRDNPDYSVQDLREVMAKSVDSVDNRFGQLAYDNLFWSRLMKDALLVSFLSLGWNLGTVRELGGGLVDILKNLGGLVGKEGPGFTNRMAYLLALNIGHALLASTYQYLATGKGPQEVKDLFYPKDGGTDESGKPSRVSFPDYSRDEWAWSHQPMKTLANKLHPVPAELYRVLVENRDFWGKEIWVPDDTGLHNAERLMVEFGKGLLEPISVSTMLREYKRTGSIGRTALAQIGLAPTPAYVDRTPAENAALEFLRASRPVGTRTPEAAERATKLAELRVAIQKKEPGAREQFNQAVKEGIVRRLDWTNLQRGKRTSLLESSIPRLLPWQVLDVYEKSSEAEQKSIRRLVQRRLSAASGKPDELPERVIARAKDLGFRVAALRRAPGRTSEETPPTPPPTEEEEPTSPETSPIAYNRRQREFSILQ